MLQLKSVVSLEELTVVWNKGICLEGFSAQFRELGVDMYEDFAEIFPEDLAEIGVPNELQRTFMEWQGEQSQGNWRDPARRHRRYRARRQAPQPTTGPQLQPRVQTRPRQRLGGTQPAQPRPGLGQPLPQRQLPVVDVEVEPLPIQEPRHQVAIDLYPNIIPDETRLARLKDNVYITTNNLPQQYHLQASQDPFTLLRHANTIMVTENEIIGRVVIQLTQEQFRHGLQLMNIRRQSKNIEDNLINASYTVAMSENQSGMNQKAFPEFSEFQGHELYSKLQKRFKLQSNKKGSFSFQNRRNHPNLVRILSSYRQLRQQINQILRNEPAVLRFIYHCNRSKKIYEAAVAYKELMLFRAHLRLKQMGKGNSGDVDAATRKLNDILSFIPIPPNPICFQG